RTPLEQADHRGFVQAALFVGAQTIDPAMRILGATLRRLHLKKHLIPFALLAISQTLLAQQAPSAGGQLLQIPPAPTAPRPAPEIRIEPRSVAPAPAAAEVKIVVKSLRIVGERIYTEAELLALTGFTPGRELSLT